MPLNTNLSLMDEDKLKKLEEQLYNDTPFFGDRIRQNAARELIEEKTPQTVELLIRAFIFSQDKNFRNLILNSLKSIKIQETALTDVICRIWAETRDEDLSKLIKLKGWVATNPPELRLLTALNLGWRGIIDEKGIEIIAPLINLYLTENDAFTKKIAQMWLHSLSQPELQEEVCRLASEENNQEALILATECGYTPSDPSQAALFCYFTQQWDKYREIDPDYQLLENFYYNATSELQERIEKHGITFKRLEWIWIVLGGKKGRRLREITKSQWENIIQTMVMGQHWNLLLSFVPIVPAVFSQKIVKKLETKRLAIKEPELKQKLTQLSQLFQNIKGNIPPQGNLVRCYHALEGHTKAIEAIAISPDCKTLVSAGDELIRVWDIDTGKLLNTLNGHLKPITSLCLSGDGTILASGSRDKTVSLWRLPEGNLIGNLSANTASVWSLAMTKSAKLIASASYQEIRLWQYPQGRLFKNLRGHQREVEKVILSQDDSLLIAGGGTKDNSIRVWRLPEGDHLYNLFGHQDAICDLAVTSDNKILASASKDHTIKLWSLEEGKEIATLEGHLGRVWCLAITSDNENLVTGSDDGTVKIWSLTTHNLLDTFAGHEDGIFCLDISPDGRLLATGGRDKTVRMWDLTTGENVNTLNVHQGIITQIKFTDDGTNLITGSGDRTLKIWRWDLSRLCNISPRLMTKEDKQWLKSALESGHLTPQEQEWITLLAKLQKNE
ncbi:hypothetical protein CSQ80_02050 [Cyanobacterium aponinum IPPAS B-1201]|nr:hypothetical protein CSQ80_02050 [Cyanobacterium aponinum IPPAS B-1201]